MRSAIRLGAIALLVLLVALAAAATIILLTAWVMDEAVAKSPAPLLAPGKEDAVVRQARRRVAGLYTEVGRCRRVTLRVVHCRASVATTVVTIRRSGDETLHVFDRYHGRIR